MIYRFNDFELDAERFELRHAGAPRHVEPLVFDLIVYLARHPGRVLSRDEIIDQVWNGRSVSDATVASGLKSARKALDDSGGSQALIETVRGRGVRFNGQVTLVTPPSEAGLPEPLKEEPGDASTEVAQPCAPSRKPVLAILPFDNLSAEDDSYFADGLTEDIITNLSRFRELGVIARTSSFRFRKSSDGLLPFCAELNAGYAVEGSVRRSGERVRITAQLIDATTGVHLWAESYDRNMEDIFTVQDEVTRTIAATLGITMQDVALQRAMKKSPAELDAYDCVLRARRYTTTLSAESHAEARDLLERAVALDPANADAHALLANVYLAEHRFDTNPRPDPMGRALRMAEAATRLDPQNAYARCWLAIVHFFRHENEKFEAEARRALDLNPNDPEILADIGHYLAFMGAFERGVELSRRARELNPLHPGWYHFGFARQHYNERNYEAVLADVQRVALPGFYWCHLLNAAALGQLGRPDAARSLARLRDLKPDFRARDELLKWNAADDDLEHLMAGLRKAGLDAAS